MKTIQLNGLGLVGGFGSSKEDLLTALENRVTPIAKVEMRDHLFPVFKADTTSLKNYLKKNALRRLDHFSRMALLGAFQALDDAGLPDLDLSRLGVVISSGFGAMATTFKFLDSLLEAGDTFSSPTAFSNSVHNAAAAHISMQLKIIGPCLTISQFDQSLVSGLLAARQWLAEGRVDAVLLGAVDEYCSVLGYCWERFLGSCKQSLFRPLDFSRNSAIAGEGAAFFLLQADARNEKTYCQIDGVEMGNLYGSKPQLNAGQPLILGCEGLKMNAAYYQKQLEETATVACYSLLYGASPVTQAFDLAVAGLALQRGRLFPSADAGPEGLKLKVVTTEQDCHALSCLRFGLSGEYAAIHLQQGGK